MLDITCAPVVVEPTVIKVDNRGIKLPRKYQCCDIIIMTTHHCLTEVTISGIVLSCDLEVYIYMKAFCIIKNREVTIIQRVQVIYTMIQITNHLLIMLLRAVTLVYYHHNVAPLTTKSELVSRVSIMASYRHHVDLLKIKSKLLKTKSQPKLTSRQTNSSHHLRILSTLGHTPIMFGTVTRLGLI